MSKLTAETHGGDDVYRVKELVVDLSVTTNALGPVAAGLEAVQACVGDLQESRGGGLLGDEVVTLTCAAVEHYPKRRDMQFRNRVAGFLADDPAVDRTSRGFGGLEAADYERRLMVGAGASELIDLLGRCGPPGGYLIDPQVRVQYREYQRAAKNAGRELASIDDARLIAIVNPNNPTGDFQERASIEAYIEQARPGTWVLVDESMLFWAGPNWRDRGMTGRRGAEFIQRMAAKGVMVFIVHSWTKIFSCTGLRVGSVLCPTPELRAQLEGRQVPWSVSAFAMAYLNATLAPATVQKYLTDTWEHTPKWRQFTIERLQSLFPSWTFHGHGFLSWIWVDTHDTEVAELIYDVGFESGCPIRLGAIGYGLPTHIRFAVRKPAEFLVLFRALQKKLEGEPQCEEGCGTASKVDALPAGLGALLQLLEQSKAETLLDLGCGTGDYLAPVAPKLKQVHGIDSNVGMLSQCAAKVEELGLRNVQLQQGSLLGRLPFQDAALDAVVVHQVLHRVDAPGGFAGSWAAEAHRVLKPGGLLWVCLDPEVPRAHLEDLYTAAGFKNVTSAGSEPQQGDACDPLTTQFRNGDSQCSMATQQEVAHAGQTVREALQHQQLGTPFDEPGLDAGRHTGQTTWTYGWKP